MLRSAFPNYSDLQTPFSLVLAGVREENYSSVADGPGDAGVVGEQTSGFSNPFSAQGHLAGDRLLVCGEAFI